MIAALPRLPVIGPPGRGAVDRRAPAEAAGDRALVDHRFPAWVRLIRATAVDNAGQVAGIAIGPDGSLRVVLLTPR